MHRRSECRYLCLIPSLWDDPSITITHDVSCRAPPLLPAWGSFPLVLVGCRVLSQVLSFEECFFYIYRDDYVVLSFILLIWCIPFVEPALLSWDKSYIVMVYNPFKYCKIQFANILIKIFCVVIVFGNFLLIFNFFSSFDIRPNRISWEMLYPLYPEKVCVALVLHLWMFHRIPQWSHLDLSLFFLGKILITNSILFIYL